MTVRVFKDNISDALIILGPAPKFEGKSALTIFSNIDGEYMPSYDYTFEFGAKDELTRPIHSWAEIGSMIKTKHETFDEWLADKGEETIYRSITGSYFGHEIVEQTNYDLNTCEPVGDDDYLYGSSSYNINKSIFE